jgi:hypothetical protein
LTLVLAIALSGAAAYAQAVKADVGFSFVAGGKVMPAGKYEIEVTAQTGPVMLTGPDHTRVMLPVITMLGRHDKDIDPELVFDKVGTKLELSEVWLPNQDGYLLLATKARHEHAVVGGSNPRK